MDWYLCGYRRGEKHKCVKVNPKERDRFLSTEIRGSTLVPICRLNPFKEFTLTYKLLQMQKVKIVDDIEDA